MKSMDIDSARTAISGLLIGMSLDSLRVYSTILLLGFYRFDATALPGEVWISCSGNVLLKNSRPDESEINENDVDFFARRASILGRIYNLIGATVSSVDIDPSGVLTVTLSGKEIRFQRDKDSFEEIWAVMSDSPDVSDAHRWYIALDDAGQIGGKISDV